MNKKVLGPKPKGKSSFDYHSYIKEYRSKPENKEKNKVAVARYAEKNRSEINRKKYLFKLNNGHIEHPSTQKLKEHKIQKDPSGSYSFIT